MFRSILFCAILFYSTRTAELSPHTKPFSTLFLLSRRQSHIPSRSSSVLKNTAPVKGKELNLPEKVFITVKPYLQRKTVSRSNTSPSNVHYFSFFTPLKRTQIIPMISIKTCFRITCQSNSGIAGSNKIRDTPKCFRTLVCCLLWVNATGPFPVKVVLSNGLDLSGSDSE